MVEAGLILEGQTKNEFQQVMEHIANGNNFLLSGGAGSGKTYSLVQVIRQVIDDNPTLKVACMTYTNAAVKEIEERVNHKNLNVSTIHDFLWDNIKHFQKELKSAIINLVNDESITKIRIDGFDIIPDDFFDNREKPIKIQYREHLKLKEGIISHDELLVIADYMFGKYIKLCDIVKDKYRFIFIDEYQDTHREVVKILLEHFTKSKKKNIIGFFGDAMQSIYDDGVGNINDYKGDEKDKVKEVKKVQNRRNPQKVINLANKLRNDGIEQEPSKDNSAPNMINGHVKEGQIMFLHSKEGDISKVEQYLFEEYGWNFSNTKETKELNLTHNLIADKAGFRTLMNIYDKDEVLKYLSLLRKFIRIRNYNYSEESSLDDLYNNIRSTITAEMASLGLSSFTVLKYIENLKQKYPHASSAIESLLSQIKPINDNTIKDEQKPIVSDFKKVTGIEEIDFIYQIKLMKDLNKGIGDNYLGLYETIKDELYDKVKSLYAESSQLIDDKKQDEEDENKKGSKRDNLIRHLYRIQTNINLYTSKKFNEFLKITDYKKRIKTAKDKKDLKENIEELIKVGDKTIEKVIAEAHEKGICLIDEKLERFCKEKEYIYNQVKNVKYNEFQKLYVYLEGQTPFSTQHKTKGAEFDNVFVILDNGRWNDYNFEYLFLGGSTARVLERTQKIFYVCCTRAKENLAVFYHDPNPAVISKATALFDGNVISLDRD